MEITWLGHASFLLKDTKGRTLLTDPFDDTVGYEVFKGQVDVVTVSHSHFDHNYTKSLEGSFELINEVGLFYACDIPIKGIPSFHDKEQGAKRGENIIYTFEMEEYTFCHLGDLGHDLSQEDLDMIGLVDVLFIPVGGNYTVDGKEAAKIAKKMNCKIVIPMHYKTPALSFPLDGVEDFLIHFENIQRIGSNTLVLEKEMLETPSVRILDYHS